MLDLGCGPGSLTARVASAVGTHHSIGIDVVPENIVSTRHLGNEGIIANLDKGVPLRDESVDIVVLSHVIEHVADTDSLVKECHRVLKRGGYIVVATPNLAALPNICYLILGKQPAIAEVSDVALVGTLSVRGELVGRKGPAHRRIFTPGALVGLLKFYGFSCEKVSMQGFLPFPEPVAGIASKLLPRYAWNIIVKARKTL